MNSYIVMQDSANCYVHAEIILGAFSSMELAEEAVKILCDTHDFLPADDCPNDEPERALHIVTVEMDIHSDISI